MTVKPTTVVIGSSGMTVRPVAHFANNAPDREQRRRSIVILSLLATSAFLFVLSLCLLTALVMVGRNLSSNAGSHAELTAVSDDMHLFINHNNIDGEQTTGDSGSGPSQYNRSTIFLPNSVYYSVTPTTATVESGLTTGQMNRVFKMGTQVVEKLGFRL
uniref:Uncharacterized protein n=1 Tax=Anopheles maculatus TaxID=74869 RepID=A0A182T1X8_9DIPT